MSVLKICGGLENVLSGTKGSVMRTTTVFAQESRFFYSWVACNAGAFTLPNCLKENVYVNGS